VIRVRGKNTIWLALIALLLSSLMVGIGSTATPVKISITPARIPEHGGYLGHVGDSFEVAVEIENVIDLWSIGVTIKYAPYGRPIVAGGLQEGTFLSQGGYDTNMAYHIDVFKGEFKIAVTRLLTWGLPVEGASGDGIIATFVFTVAEGGSTPVEITEVDMRDSNFDPITNYNTIKTDYYGCDANLVRVNMPDGKHPNVGEPVTFAVRAKNFGDEELTVRARFDIERIEDGRRIKIYTGQNYAGGGLGEPLPFEEYYLAEYIGGLEVPPGGWTNYGAAVLGPPDGNYAESTTAMAWTGYYLFPQIDLAGRVIQQCDVYGYIAQPDGSTAWDFDCYLDFFDDEANYLGWAWVDSMGGSATWTWSGGRYYAGSKYDMPEYYMGLFGIPWTEEVFNNMIFSIENYCPSGPRQQIDSVKIKVEYAPITPVAVPSYTIGPGMELELPPFTIGTATTDMIGTYVATCTLEYTATGGGETAWPEGAKTRTFTFSIEP
jgi:hypothetical protein